MPTTTFGNKRRRQNNQYLSWLSEITKKAQKQRNCKLHMAISSVTEAKISKNNTLNNHRNEATGSK
uniref:Uncharacterized protein n=1 Tax=Arundo donax TaxID=35708 RepID=A0A0A9H4L4_ARUDO